MLNAFTHRALQLNLKHGRGAGVKLTPLQGSSGQIKIKIQVGQPSCPHWPSLNQFCVNELPRIYYANPSLLTFERISVADQPCGLAVVIDGKEEAVRLSMTTAGIYKNLLKTLQPYAESSSPTSS